MPPAIPTRLPNYDPKYPRTYTINFSGGRSSAYLLHSLLEGHDGQLPPHAVVVFANTGRERPATLDFVRSTQEALALDVHWLEYDYDAAASGVPGDWKNIARRVDYHSASRRGQPFEALIRSRAYLPNATQRLCTAELKVETIRRWCTRELGIKSTTLVNVLGVRYDEPRRWRRILARDGCKLLLPLTYARIIKLQVDTFWAARGDDLAIDSRLGNCDLCFLKETRILLNSIRQEPALADWWISQEDWVYNHRNQANGRTAAQFSKRRSYRDLKARACGLPADIAESDDEPAADCFCDV